MLLPLWQYTSSVLLPPPRSTLQPQPSHRLTLPDLKTLTRVCAAQSLVAQAVQQQQLGRAVAAPAAVGMGADGAATSSVTSSAVSSSGLAAVAATFTEVEPVFSDDVISWGGVGEGQPSVPILFALHSIKIRGVFRKLNQTRPKAILDLRGLK